MFSFSPRGVRAWVPRQRCEATGDGRHYCRSSIYRKDWQLPITSGF